MKRFLAFAATTGAMGLALGISATPAVAAPVSTPAVPTQATSSSNKNYTCTNQGGGAHHKVTCIGTVNGNNVTVNIDDIKVLNYANLVLLQNLLNTTAVTVANLDVATQIKQIELAVLNFYVSKLIIPITVDKIQVCVAAKCG